MFIVKIINLRNNISIILFIYFILLIILIHFFFYFKAGKKIFRDFLRCEYSEENILFWMAVEELKKESNPDIIEEKARFIYEDYISILSPKEVSVVIIKIIKIPIEQLLSYYIFIDFYLTIICVKGEFRLSCS